jgi:hypothetical protein
MAASKRGSVTSLVRTWPSTIVRRKAAKSGILVPRDAHWNWRPLRQAMAKGKLPDAAGIRYIFVPSPIRSVRTARDLRAFVSIPFPSQTILCSTKEKQAI